MLEAPVHRARLATPTPHPTSSAPGASPPTLRWQTLCASLLTCPELGFLDYLHVVSSHYLD